MISPLIGYLGLNSYSDLRNNISSIFIEYKKYLVLFENNIFSIISNNGDIICQ
jgi:hypothetical protein